MKFSRLDDTLRDLAKRGQLNHLSLVAHTAKGVVTFRAAYRGATGDGHKNAEHGDPVKALQEVLK
jgi:hypothetical protein